MARASAAEAIWPPRSWTIRRAYSTMDAFEGASSPLRGQQRVPLIVPSRSRSFIGAISHHRSWSTGNPSRFNSFTEADEPEDHDSNPNDR